MNKVLVVAPHPDDETLGCGGTILRHINEGDEVYWLIMTEISESIGFSSQKVQSRKLEIDKVSIEYQFSGVEIAGFDSMSLDRYPKGELVAAVSKVIKAIKPNIIYLPYRSDAHSDHAAVFDAVASCTKSFRYPFISSIRAYETLSETEFGLRPEDGGFRPNLFINITGFKSRKIQIMNLYEGEMGNHPFPRSVESIEALATLRGSTAGCNAAEAFMILREIV
ncbi:PIG-L family deacetylase [Oceaniserpentilla sp. 4NH20-0058]|uniref:PIG-L deacetylase family protein n=1 Tax=Oceaniserpentilla sp. 4NH20-0058 TaxID=3127660 RepID=UPI0031089774